MIQTNDAVDETELVSTSIDSDVSTDTEDFSSGRSTIFRDGSTNQGEHSVR